MSDGVRDNSFPESIKQLVHMNLAFHNLNKTAEEELGISLVQYHLLNILKDMPGSSPQNLSKAAGMHPSTLTQSMKRLMKKEMIFVVEDPRDSRKKVLGITLSGKNALNDFENGIGRLITKAGNRSRVWSDAWPSSPLFEAKT